MEQWQQAASEQAQLISGRLAELLSRGQLWLRTELGVDLGLKPELLPPWLILLAACSGLMLMLALWASLCRAVFRRSAPVSVLQAEGDSGVEARRADKPAREEPKRKKKKSEKKSQPNGRAVVEPQEEEAVEPEEIVPHHHQPPPPEVKTEKGAEAKKSKKKSKQVAKEPAKIITAESKEPEEGTWETKVSNKEKREQRKKDKGSSDGSSSPGGGDTPVTTTSEQPKGSPAAPPANQKKKKGGDKVKPEKVEPVLPKAPVKSEPASAPVLMTEAPKVPPQALTPKVVNWATNREPASLWGSEIDGSWTVIDRSSLGTFSGLGVPAVEPKSATELPWLNQPAVDDEWSGINGGSIDCNSDWNAPSEVWGNYEEPTPAAESADLPPAPEPDQNNLLIEAADEDNEKEKDDLSGEGTTKSKRKKKKKKKAAEDGVAAGQGEESEKEVPLSSVKKQPPVQDVAASVQTSKPATTEGKAERTMKENAAQKPPVTQVPQKPPEGAPTANSSPPAPTQQKKSEEPQAPKPAKKKKARRET